MKTTRWILGIVGGFLFIGQASATLIGDTITVDWLFPDTATIFATDTVTVGGGVEIDCPSLPGGPYNICTGFNADSGSIDIGADTITLQLINGTYWNPTSFNGFRFSGIDSAITGYTLSTNIAGLDASRIAYGVDFISVNLQGLGQDVANDSFTLTLQQVPEPATLSLIGFGLVGLGFLRKKQAA